MPMHKDQLLVVYLMQSHYLKQWWLIIIVNWTLKNKVRWNLNQNTTNFIQKIKLKMPPASFCLCLNVITCPLKASWRWNSMRIPPIPDTHCHCLPPGSLLFIMLTCLQIQAVMFWMRIQSLQRNNYNKFRANSWHLRMDSCPQSLVTVYGNWGFHADSWINNQFCDPSNFI